MKSHAKWVEFFSFLCQLLYSVTMLRTEFVARTPESKPCLETLNFYETGFKKLDASK
jgi:hypothetical protein